jgi:hypothetical protein
MSNISLVEKVIVARLSRLNWADNGRPSLIAGHAPARVLGVQTEAEVEWFAMALKPVVPSNDGVVLPPMKFRGVGR